MAQGLRKVAIWGALHTVPNLIIVPKLHTHDCGHFDLAAEEHLVTDKPELGVNLIILHRAERFVKIARPIDKASLTFWRKGHGIRWATWWSRRRRAPWWPTLNRKASGRYAKRWRHPNEWRDHANHCPRQLRAFCYAARLAISAILTATRRAQWTKCLLAAISLSLDSFDKDVQDRPVWPLCRLHIGFDDGDYEQNKDTEPETT